MSKYYVFAKEFIAPKLEKGLYIVATPIGNLKDISIRALEVLASADLIICEDTRTSAKLLNHYGIKTKRLAFHEHNEREKTNSIIKRLETGQSVALISDAGTPLINDPGFVLVRSARERGLNIFSLPGACALIAALSIAGLPSDNFSFHGFLPPKAGTRKNALEKLKNNSETLIFYESPRRLSKTIDAIKDIFGEQTEVAIALEISKKFERVMRGSLLELSEALSDKQIKGEAVILVSGAKEIELDENIWKSELKNALRDKTLKSSVDEITTKFNLKRKKVYDEALKIKQEKG